jgi:hypothetical protein
MVGACSMPGRDDKYKIFIGKPEGKRPHRTPSIDKKTIIEWILAK